MIIKKEERLGEHEKKQRKIEGRAGREQESRFQIQTKTWSKKKEGRREGADDR